MLANINDDLKYADGLEDIRFHFAGLSEVRQVPSALQRAVSVREAVASGGAYTTEDVQYLMLASAFDATPPGVGGLIERLDRSEAWSVFGLDRIVHRTKYRAWCKRAVTLADLTDMLRIQSPSYGRDSDLVATLTWSDIAGGPLRGLIQEIDQSLTVEQDRRLVVVTHRIYCAAPRTVQAGHRVLDSDSMAYNILRVTGRDVLGSLVVFDCELARVPQGK